jgi:hypothetical protein
MDVVHNVPSISVDVLRLILKRQGDQPNFCCARSEVSKVLMGISAMICSLFQLEMSYKIHKQLSQGFGHRMSSGSFMTFWIHLDPFLTENILV